MKSKTLGKSTSKVEVLNIDVHGIWLYAQGKEYFLPYEEFLGSRTQPLQIF